VRSLLIVSEHSGYRVTPLARPAGAAVRLIPTRPQPSAPNPGPTLEVTLPRARHARFAARIAVTPVAG
jgi:hypothetical protein